MAQTLGELAPEQVGALLALVGVRAVVAALPTTVLMREISWTRATRNDLAGSLVQNFAPPPADIGVRYAMLRSWRVDPADGMASLVLAGLIFYAGRCAAPAAGFAVVLISGRIDTVYQTVAVVCGVAFLVLAAVVAVLPRSPRAASWVARFVASVVGRVRAVDVEAWETASVEFSMRTRERLGRGWVGAAVAVAALLVVESLIFVVCLRMVGVAPDVLVTHEIVGAFLVAYPLTMLPFSGIVFLDAVLLTLLQGHAGGDHQAQIAAGLMLWRITTLLVPFLLGLLVLVRWQRREGRGMAWRTGSSATH